MKSITREYYVYRYINTPPVLVELLHVLENLYISRREVAFIDQNMVQISANLKFTLKKKLIKNDEKNTE